MAIIKTTCNYFYFLKIHYNIFISALTTRVETLENLVAERDARISALEKALQAAESKMADVNLGKFITF